MAWTPNPTLGSTVPFVGTPKSVNAVRLASNAVFVGPDDTESVTVLSGPATGFLSVSADNDISLVLTGEDVAVGTVITSRVRLNRAAGNLEYALSWVVVAGVQEKGWHDGRHYLTPIVNDRVVISTGATHRKVYVSGAGKTAATIATELGVSEATVTGDWLAANHPSYGATEAEKLETALGYALWEAINPNPSVNSHWLLFEHGHTYTIPQIIPRASSGEGPTTPKYIGAFGAGTLPRIATSFTAWQAPSSFVVLEGIEVEGASLMGGAGSHYIYNDVTFVGSGHHVVSTPWTTYTNCTFKDVKRTEPGGGRTDWLDALADRASGLYGADGSYNVLFDNTFVDACGWDKTWRLGDDPLDATTPHPPSMYSHNLYNAAETFGYTYRDSFSTRAASIGSQFRGGVHINNVVYIANPIALNALGGDYLDAGPIGNHSAISRVLVTQTRNEKSTIFGGALGWGIDSVKLSCALTDSLICHTNDPTLGDAQGGVALPEPSDLQIQDVVIHRWGDGNTGAMDQASLNAVSVQAWALIKAGEGTYEAYCEWLRTLTPTQRLAELNAFQDYMRAPFGLPVRRTTAATCTFRPFDPGATGDGIRWDNPLNWSTEDIPGTHIDDAVVIGQCKVIYCANMQVASISLDEGVLIIAGGRLTVGSVTGTGSIVVEGAGDLVAGSVAAGVTV